MPSPAARTIAASGRWGTVPLSPTGAARAGSPPARYNSRVATDERLERLPPRDLLPGGGPTVPGDFLGRMQQLTRALAYDPSSWTDEARRFIVELFDERAPTWHARGSEENRAPLADALARGQVAPGGACVEIGSGTGLHTPALEAHFDEVVSVEISPEMLAMTPPGTAHLLLADAARLPLAAGSVTAVVCVNAFLFAAEYARVLRPDGALVFVSTSGEDTPIYLPPDDVVAAFRRVSAGREATTSRAVRGTWTVVRHPTGTDHRARRPPG